jgi:hypothetical protein
MDAHSINLLRVRTVDHAQRPGRDEAAEYYFTYIDKVGYGSILETLDTQAREATAFFDSISDEQSLHRYAPDKWTIRDVLGHLNDGERLWMFRAMWFARGLKEALPSFDQDVVVTHARANDRPWRDHVDEFRVLRAASLALYRSLPADAWSIRGVASGQTVSVRALAFITAGHVAHHLGLLRERYLTSAR